jgi:hypothetical protein
MANEVMRTLSFHVAPLADADSVVDFCALESMTIVGVSLCATVFTGSPTGFNIDIQDDGTDVMTAIAANTALTPGTWQTPHMGGTETPVTIAAGSEVEIDLNLTGGSSPTAEFDVVLWYLAGAQC